MKKVTKKLAKEIATKFFGKAVKLVEDIDPTKQRVFYNDGYLFENGAVQLNVFPCFGGKGKGFEYPNEYPCGQVLVNRVVTCHLRYVDGEFERTLMYKQNDYRGVVRSIERDGRLSIPSEFWNRAGIQKLDKVEVLLTVQNEIIIFAAGYGRRDYIGIERIVGNNKQISIPAEYRRVLGLKANVEVEIFLTAQKEIIVKPYNKTSVQNVRTK